MRSAMMTMMIALLLAVAATASPPGREGMERQREGRGEIMKDLDLGDDQLKKFQEVRRSAKREMIALRSELELARLDFDEELQKGKPDKRKIAGLVEKIANLEAEKTRHKLNMKVRLVEILTPDQRKKLMMRMSERMYHRKEGRFGGGGDGPPGPRPGHEEHDQRYSPATLDDPFL